MQDAAQVISSVRPVDSVSQVTTCATVTMTVEITQTKSTVNTVNVANFDCSLMTIAYIVADRRGRMHRGRKRVAFRRRKTMIATI